MRKLILFTLTFTFSISILYSQEKVTWDFPIRHGTNEWEKLTSYEEKLSAYNIPNEILYKIKTTELVQTCLNYPELRLIMTRNSLQQGYDYIKSIFNGFEELEKRNDAGKELLKAYKKLDPKTIKEIDTPVGRGRYTFQFTYIEMLLAQNKILANIDKINKKELMKVAISNYEDCKEMPEHYSTLGLISSTLVLGRMLEIDQFSKYDSQKTDNNKIKRFVEKSYLEDVSTLSQIIFISKEYLKQLENE